MLSSLSYSIFLPNVIELILFELVTAHLMIKTDFRTFWFSLGALLRKIGKKLLLFFESNYFWETNKQKLFPNNFFSKSPKLPRIITQKLKFYIWHLPKITKLFSSQFVTIQRNIMSSVEIKVEQWREVLKLCSNKFKSIKSNQRAYIFRMPN